MKFKDYLSANFIIGLSPMDGVTDEPYRQTQCYVHRPDVIFTEFVSAEGISHGAVKLYDELLFSANERPIIGQIFGKDPASFYQSAIILSHLGFDGIDINMGCPAHTVTQHGSGAALIDKPELASEIITSVRQGIDDYFSGQKTINNIGLKKSSLDIIERNLKYSDFTPTLDRDVPTLSLKTRLGTSVSTIERWMTTLLTHPLDFMTLHGRTLKQGYSGLADWDAIALAASMAKDKNIPLWGNGDILSLAQAHEYGQKYGVSGILIGRASMGNPWIFTDHIPTLQDRFSLMCYHAQEFIRIFPNRQFDPMRKHFLLYTSGHPRAKDMRAKLVRISSIEELYALEDEYLNC